MTKLNITGVKPGSTSLKLTAGTVTKNVPVTVKSRNLLSYGPAEGNGLTVTVNSDGSLHITGTASKQWTGVAWVFPCPVQGNVTLRTPTSTTGLSVNVKFVLLQCLFDRFGSVFPQCGLMVFPGVVIVSR